MAVDFKKLGKNAKATSKGKVEKTTSKDKAKKEETKPAAKGGGEKQYDDTNRFVLFVNDKEGNDARPDYTGKITVLIPTDAKPGEAIELRLAGWIKDSDRVGQFISGQISEPMAQE
jgi:hypothetical protein